MTQEKCDDNKCFKHGGVKVRGGNLGGKVVSTKGKHTVVVERSTTDFFSKYQKWARGTSRISAHNPGCMNARVNDYVVLGETRKLSKTKAWTVVEIVTGGSS